jgi:DNA-binding NtrC family response regulator
VVQEVEFAMSGEAPQTGALFILVVDDEVELLGEVARYLRRRGHRVQEASSFAAGRRMIESAADPDVLVTDVRMPGGNGLDLARRARELHARCRIVVMTGHLDPSQIESAEEAGAAAVLFKPFSFSKLLELVLAAAPRRHQAASAPAIPEPA